MPCQIVPALLTNDEQQLKELQQKLSFAPLLQLDIMDGKFVPSVSVSLDTVKDNPFESAFEVHLMVYHPEQYFQTVKDIGAQGVIFHVESTDDICFAIDEAKALGLKVSLAINPDMPYTALKAYLDNLDGVLFMTVYPGFYGAKFEPKVLKKIESFRALYPNIEIAIDGGAKISNIEQIRDAGVNKICVGSAIAMNADPQVIYNDFFQLANKR